ncbi:putative TonB-dependent receptor [Sphingomonas changbaiensis NBRC 104936]|uniref:Putative TonB-dependent receptor n=1 Tax=Sphingomonas changbaiensis NBRC 104936 TaxID=1219043 RepID=A0A0E9MSW3_9SPHN|nr:TonB-dependent receptor [Sphingomonas changbaiensis]GAO40664.1 putative TonB-dependent receptor [Sphingomonas changbaiensis NBRC 104936]
MQLALRRHLLASTVLIGTSMLGTAAYAQTQAAAAPADEGTIVVTGSLITNPNLERSTPVNVTTSEEVELRQTNVAEQLLREVPGVVPSTGSAVNNGNGGSSFVNLRGLGSNRNLVLLDGVRIAPSGLVGRVDLNNIPLALIERTEVLTGGASTTYGADAIAGVVNFITKRNFSGLEATASEQITERGDGNVFRVDTTIGANFDDGRGNAVFSIGYQEADPVTQGARDFSRFNINAFTGNISGSGTKVPTTFTVVGTTAQAVDPTTGQFVPSANFPPFNFNPYNIFQTPFQRFNLFGQANYQVTDGVEVYTRGLFSKNTVKTIIAPSGAFGIDAEIPISNTLLPTPAALTLCQRNIDLDPRDPDVDADGNVISLNVLRPTLAQCQAARTSFNQNNPLTFDPTTGTFNNGTYLQAPTQVSRRATENGPRISDFRTQIFDYRLGVRGGITDSINYDVFGSYGESDQLQTIQNYTLNSRFRQGLLTTQDANGNLICQDPAFGCVPVNAFGPEGSITKAQAAFLTANSTVLTRTSLAQARATISGDFGASLPWASDAISFALGGEYRRYKASQASDTLAASGDLGGSGGPTPNIAGGFDVYEAFGELIAPIVQDKPFFQNLTFEGGIRYSHYTINAPGTPKFNTTTYKLGGSWEPVSAIKFRGNYAHAVRAPNIAELFAPQATGLTTISNDPCASLNDAGTVIRPTPTGTLALVCRAQGAPITQIGLIPQPTAGQGNATSGGNLNLKPEKSNSYTFGAVIQPDFLPGFSASVDYYHIKITGAITTPTVDDAIQACFGAPDAAGNFNPAAGAENSAACTIIKRNAATGALAGDPTVTPGLFLPLSNLGTIETDGIDVTMNYRADLGFAKLALNFAGNWTNSSKFKATPTSATRECVGLFSGNCGSPGGAGADIGSIQPEFSWTQRSTLSFDNVDLSLLWRHISAVHSEDGDSYIGPVPGKQSNLPGSPPPGTFGTRNFNFLPSADYFDLATRIGVGDNLTLTLTVANLFDKQPPFTGQDVGSTSFNSGNIYPSTYDALGRTYRVSARLRF